MSEVTCASCEGPLENPERCDPQYQWVCAACDQAEHTASQVSPVSIRAGDRVKVVGNTESEEEDYIGAVGMVTIINPTGELPVSVLLDSHEAFGPVYFAANELEVIAPA